MNFQIPRNAPLRQRRTVTTSTSRSFLTPGRLTPALSWGTWFRGRIIITFRATGSLTHPPASTVRRTTAQSRFTHSGARWSDATRTFPQRAIRSVGCGKEMSSMWMWSRSLAVRKSNLNVTSFVLTSSQVDHISASNVARYVSKPFAAPFSEQILQLFGYCLNLQICRTENLIEVLHLLMIRVQRQVEFKCHFSHKISDLQCNLE